MLGVGGRAVEVFITLVQRVLVTVLASQTSFLIVTADVAYPHLKHEF